MSTVYDDIAAGLDEAIRYARGEATGATEHLVPVVDVRALRRRLGLSQQAFADRFGIPLATLKNWEQGRRAPDAPALAYLRVIARIPEAVEQALRDAPIEPS